MFLTPDHLVQALHLKEGDRVADFGAGAGAYTIALARDVGNTGMVYAVDVHRDMLHTLLGTLERQNLLNVDIIWADVEKSVPIEKYSLDAAVISNVLFQLYDIPKALSIIGSLVKPEGQILIVDWSASHGGMGPHQDHVIRESRCEELCIQAGFRILKRLPAGDYHYAFIAITN